jgi:hypothetical protein
MVPGGLIKTQAIPTALIAPCGMNCRLCMAYGRDKNPCPGCRRDVGVKPKTRAACRIKTCEKISQGEIRYCNGCDGFPCDKLKHLDKRYKTKYGMSMIENLMNIKQVGIRHFIKDEKERWTCSGCGAIICVHKPQCLSCGHEWR